MYAFAVLSQLTPPCNLKLKYLMLKGVSDDELTEIFTQDSAFGS